MCGSLKAEGFGDGKCQRNHPQAALEAATQSYKDDLKFMRDRSVVYFVIRATNEQMR